MKGLVVGDGGALSWSEVPDAEPGPGEVRIRVVGAGLNRADLMQRAGHYPPPPGAPTWLGLECSGVIEPAKDGDGGVVGDRLGPVGLHRFDERGPDAAQSREALLVLGTHRLLHLIADVFEDGHCSPRRWT
ncbi:MAG: alcohol dehydrogenase catalytic domain-containing protein [Myxococcota bacterium]